ncbi:MAG: TRAP transporter large permease [Treponema sp.]|nr:TRAP transporter large permease [Treponema sp.]
MPVMTITLIVLAIVMLAAGVPVAAALGLASALVLFIFRPIPNMMMLPQLFSEAAANFILLAVPLFVLVGVLMERGTMGRNLIDFSKALIGWVKGGLGAVNIVGSMIFSGISGSSVADTATFSTLLVPRMVDEGYPADYSAAVTVTSSTMSTIRPPSIQIVLAAAATNQSVGRALAAGLLPAILVGLLLLVPNYFISKKMGYGQKHPFSFATLVEKTKKCWTALFAPVIIMGSIFSGLVTPTEAAALAVLYILVVDCVIYRKLGLRDLWECFKKTAGITSAILLIASASALMNFIIAFEHIPAMLTAALTAVPGGRFGFMVLFFFLAIIIGMVLDATPATLIFAPLFLPAAVALGFDPTHFIIIWVMCVALGMTTPGYGVCVFSAASITGVPIDRMVRQAIPFYLVTIFAMVLVAAFPIISLAVPRLLGW